MPESAKDLGGSYYSSEPTGSELEIAIQPGSARYVGGQMHVGGLPQSGEWAPGACGCGAHGRLMACMVWRK